MTILDMKENMYDFCRLLYDFRTELKRYSVHLNEPKKRLYLTNIYNYIYAITADNVIVPLPSANDIAPYIGDEKASTINRKYGQFAIFGIPFSIKIAEPSDKFDYIACISKQDLESGFKGYDLLINNSFTKFYIVKHDDLATHWLLNNIKQPYAKGKDLESLCTDEYISDKLIFDFTKEN